jgi:small GTP-binding protein
MISKKICMLGAFAVGKTSMVSRFVLSTFSEKYQTTVGVKVDKKIVRAREQEVTLMLWDLAGEDVFHKVQMSYFRGASGLIIVVDGTRRSTLDMAITLRQRVEDSIGPTPVVLVINKLDLLDIWEVNPADIENLKAQGLTVIRASAATAEGVEEAFQILTRKMVG